MTNNERRVIDLGLKYSKDSEKFFSGLQKLVLENLDKQDLGYQISQFESHMLYHICLLIKQRALDK